MASENEDPSVLLSKMYSHHLLCVTQEKMALLYAVESEQFSSPIYPSMHRQNAIDIFPYSN